MSDEEIGKLSSHFYAAHDVESLIRQSLRASLPTRTTRVDSKPSHQYNKGRWQGLRPLQKRSRASPPTVTNNLEGKPSNRYNKSSRSTTLNDDTEGDDPLWTNKERQPSSPYVPISDPVLKEIQHTTSSYDRTTDR